MDKKEGGIKHLLISAGVIFVAVTAGLVAAHYIKDALGAHTKVATTAPITVTSVAAPTPTPAPTPATS